MTITVKAFGNEFNFPEGTSEEVMRDAIMKYSEQASPVDVAKEAVSQIGTGIKETAQDVVSGVQEELQTGDTARAISQGTKSFLTDPVGNIRRGVRFARNSAEAFAEELANSSNEIAGSLAGEAIGRRLPIVRGELGARAGSILGAATGRQTERDEPFTTSLGIATRDELVGLALSKVGEKWLLDKKVDKDSRLRDTVARHEFLSEAGKEVDVQTAAKELIGEEIPVPIATKGEHTNASINKEIMTEVNQAGKDSFLDTKYAKYIKDTEKALESKLKKGSTSDMTASNLQEALNTAVDSRSKAISEISKRMNAVANNSKAGVPIGGLSTKLDELAITTGATLGDETAAKIIAEIRPAFYTKGGMPKKVTSLKEYATVRNKLDGMASKYATTAVQQSEINGIVGEIKNKLFKSTEAGIMQAIMAGGIKNPDVATYFSALEDVRNIAHSRSEIVGTRLSGRAGVTEVQQAKKALSAKELMKASETSLDSYETARRVMAEASPRSELAFKDEFLRGIYSDLDFEKGLSPDQIKKVLGDAQRPTAKAEILAKHYPDTLKAMEQTRLILDTFEQFGKKAGQGAKDVDVDTVKELGKIGTGTLAGQGLIVATAKRNVIAGAIRNLSLALQGSGSRIMADRSMLEGLTGAEGERLVKQAMRPLEKSSDEVYDTYKRIATNTGRVVMSEELFNNVMAEYHNFMTGEMGVPSADVSLGGMLMLENMNKYIEE